LNKLFFAQRYDLGFERNLIPKLTNTYMCYLFESRILRKQEHTTNIKSIYVLKLYNT